MSTPIATLDDAYSDPRATAVEWDRARAELEGAQLFWLTTVRADGRPHVTPVVAAWAEDAVWFATGEEEQKFANLRTNPHVVLTTGCNRWDRGVDVVVEGEARQVTDDDVLTRVAAEFAAKWDGRWQYVPRGGRFRAADDDGGGPRVFAVTPVKVFAHAKGDPFGSTKYTF